MNQAEFAERFKHLQDKCFDICTAKNKDYSKEDDAFSNFKRGRQSVPAKVLSRMEDKLSRVENILHTIDPQINTDETLEDTLIDLANYALIMAIAIGEVDDNG